MIRMSVLYPTAEGRVFDHDYYRDRHVPLALRTWGLERAEILLLQRAAFRRIFQLA